ncbi:MAG: ATP-dependent DNA helicase [Rhodospirillaceae bacterium]|nr:ATP-dependent DNA helicase [Rhodospirillaceae bacterium]MYB15337.1 ATP-dependent DNA helicase [Rhodospirillaceae bacterium]MYI47945.1 ATP-dependent DNA helicase [Rhodospirillaceae bacterium]
MTEIGEFAADGAGPKGRDGLSAGAVLVVGSRRALWRRPEGADEDLSLPALADRLATPTIVGAERSPPLHCYGAGIARRLGIRRFPGRDILDLFAFARPGVFCLPTPAGIAAALSLAKPHTPAEEADTLTAAAALLLEEIADLADDPAGQALSGARPIARAMAAGGWSWAGPVLAALKIPAAEAGRPGAMAGLEAWRDLPEWAERAPEPPPGDRPVSAEEARARLAALVPEEAEERPEQADYAAAAAGAFVPRLAEDEPNVVLAEAGTGVGKTIGYVAPASLWAEKNSGAVWLSTFTRNLQNQIDGELDRLYPDPAEKARKAVLRKGRENYLCLLNLDDAVAVARTRREDAVALGLVARWLTATRDGALVAGDLPGWLADRIGRARIDALTDHRGECVYAACRHYSRCFVEHSARRARRARIVIANHALVMAQTAMAAIHPRDNLGDPHAPARLVFDEGHHLFGAADSAFAAHLSGQETADLRRWLRGAEAAAGRRSRVRGLNNRIGDLIVEDEAAAEALDRVLRHAAQLPAQGWLQRLDAGNPQGAAERFLAAVREQVYARSPERDSLYGLEADIRPVPELLLDSAGELDAVLRGLAEPLKRLRLALEDMLDTEAETLDTATRQRLDGAARSILRRALMPVAAWRAMLETLKSDPPDEFVDWFAVDRRAGRDIDIGMHRRWIDPMEPLAAVLSRQAHGLLMTSATMKDRTRADDKGEGDEGWASADLRFGVRHLDGPTARFAVASPFDYPAQTRIFVVRDVNGGNADQVAAAYRELFVAAGGGALGLFTAIARLRAAHERLAEPLDDAGLPLLAQHVDGFDVATLVDLFRAERNACLLGTDAVRDGIDVPGDALRLIVFDRVPWPRPDRLHRARRERFGGAAWDDMQTRLRLKQAFGRLIRRRDDRGVFVLLDSRLPTRLTTAFPDGVDVRRTGLAEAVRETRAFLAG